MSSIFRFNAHDIDDATVRRLRTGRDAELNTILRIVSSNLAAKSARSHVIVRAPRGFGKSFLMRLTQLELSDRRAAGESVGVALLPEEQMNVNAPDLLLQEIRRVFLREPPQSVVPKWDRSGLWEQARADLDTALDATFGLGQGLLVAIVENLDLLLAKAFPERVEQATLRKWLNDPANRVMLLAGSAAGDIDNSPAEPLFRQFTSVELHGWTETDCIAYLGKQMQERNQDLTDERAAKARAIATFIGGNPRLSVILGDVLLNDDALTTAALLDRLVDELTPYYQDRIQSLGGRAQSLLDALLRGGEPCSQSALAERVGAKQSDIARAFRELENGRIVVGARALDGKEKLYRVEDRVFAHYYRKRHLLHGQEYSPFEAIAEFLKLYFNNAEKREQAMRLVERGKVQEARFLLSLADQERPVSGWEVDNRRRDAQAVADRCRIGIGQISTVYLDLLEAEIAEIEQMTADPVEIRGRLLQHNSLPPALFPWHRLLVAITDYLVGSDDKARREAQAVAAEFQQANSHYGQTTALFLLAQTYPANDPNNVHTLQAALQSAEIDADMGGQELMLRSMALVNNALGQYEEALTAASQAMEIARHAATLETSISQPWVGLQASACRHAAYSLNRLGRDAEALDRAQEATLLAAQAKRLDEQVIADRLIAFSLMQLERYAEAFTVADRTAATAADIGDDLEQAECRRIAAISFYYMGDYEAAISQAREAVGLAFRNRDYFVVTDGLYWQIESAAAFHRDDDVAAATDQWLRVLPKLSDDDLRPGGSLWHLGPAMLRRNHWSDDLPLLCKAWPQFEDWEQTHCSNQTAAAAAELADAQGRAVAYAAIAGCVRALASGGAGVDFTPFLNQLLDGLAEKLTDAGLLRDVAGLVRAELPPAYATRAALMEAASLFHASGRDPASLQRVDPDIALAIRRVWADQTPAMAAPKAKAKRTVRKKAK